MTSLMSALTCKRDRLPIPIGGMLKSDIKVDQHMGMIRAMLYGEMSAILEPEVNLKNFRLLIFQLTFGKVTVFMTIPMLSTMPQRLVTDVVMLIAVINKQPLRQLYIFPLEPI